MQAEAERAAAKAAAADAGEADGEEPGGEEPDVMPFLAGVCTRDTQAQGNTSDTTEGCTHVCACLKQRFLGCCGSTQACNPYVRSSVGDHDKGFNLA